MEKKGSPIESSQAHKAGKELSGLLHKAALRYKCQRAARFAVALLYPSGLLLAIAVLLTRLVPASDRFGPNFAAFLNRLPPSMFYILGAILVFALLVVVVVALVLRVSSLLLAHRIDQTHNLDDRLGTALELDRKKDTLSPFAAAQLQDATDHISKINLATAFPWHLPKGSRRALWGGLAVLIGALVPVPGPPPSHAPTPPTVRKLDRVLPQADIVLLKEEVQALRDEAAKLDDPYLESLAGEMDALLEGLQARTLDRREFFQQARALSSRFEEAAEVLEAAREAVERSLKEARPLINSLKKEKETAALAEALEEGNLERAAQELEELANQVASGGITQEQAERLASLLEKVADRMGESVARKMAEAMSERLEGMGSSDLANKFREEMDRLRKRMGEQGAGRHERQRLNDLRDKLQQSLAQGKRQPTGDEPENPGRRLNRLEDTLKDSSQDLRDRQGQPKGPEGGQQQEGEGQDGRPKERQEAQDQMGKKRGGKGRPQDKAGQGKPGQQGQGADQATGQAGQQQRNHADAIRKASQALSQLEKARQSAQAMRKGSQTSQDMDELARRGGGQEEGEARQDRLDDFLSRAQGQPEEDQGQQQAKAPADPGRQGHQPKDTKGEPGGSGEHDPAGQGGGGEEKDGASRPGRAKGQLSDGEGEDLGGGKAGTESSEDLYGKATSLRSKREDHFVAGEHGKGPVRSSVYLDAAERGFAERSYQDLYEPAQAAAEDELERVTIPPGYRFYIRRYFRLVSPRTGGEETK